MPLVRLSIDVANLEAGRAAVRNLEGLAEAAPLAVTLFEATLPRFLVEAYFDPPPSLEGIADALAHCGVAAAELRLEPVADQNWVALSQASLPPVAAGRFIVHGSHDRVRFRMRRLAVEIEAGEAFGSGHNATTALCLEALDALVRRRRFARVLDLGCGSGVLGIAAARALPDARVLASDNDPLATTIARANARLNRVASRTRIVTATGFHHPALRRAQPLDLMLANILPGPLIDLAPAMRTALRGGGVVVLSGLLRHQAREVAAAYLAQGFRLLRRRHGGGWTALAMLNTRSSFSSAPVRPRRTGPASA